MDDKYISKWVDLINKLPKPMKRLDYYIYPVKPWHLLVVAGIGLLGAFGNHLVIHSNGGMPMAGWVIVREPGVTPAADIYGPEKLPWLGDIYRVGRDSWYSIGDVMINIARALCVAFVFYWINTYFKYRRILNDWFKKKEAKQ
jgi:hypothetical protein